jgi:hypothetical protein
MTGGEDIRWGICRLQRKLVPTLQRDGKTSGIVQTGIGISMQLKYRMGVRTTHRVMEGVCVGGTKEMTGRNMRKALH